jgi:hypothetical protein
MKDWYSGLVPYPLLLPTQLATIALMVFMVHQISRRPPRNRRLAIGISAFATLYAASMIVRFAILRTQNPGLLWYEGGMIPILFHWVLAAFLFTYARERRRPAPGSVTPPAARTR